MRQRFSAKGARLGAVAAFCIALAGCVDGSNPNLEGRCKLVGQRYDLVIELRPDGSYFATTNIGTNFGHWAQVDAEHIATWTDDSHPKRISYFKLRGNSLTIFDASNAL